MQCWLMPLINTTLEMEGNTELIGNNTKNPDVLFCLCYEEKIHHSMQPLRAIKCTFGNCGQPTKASDGIASYLTII